MKAASSSTLILSSLIFSLSAANSIKAQIVPDNTLPENSRVEAGCTNCTIDEGTQRGNNLFHSFQEFSVPTDGEAFFNNAPQIENILTRVTGNSVSNIDGLLRSNGNANLFLINPNGVIFGSNARLDIGGSFVGSTAGSILLDDGFAFSAINPQASPLLTINTPIGLQYSANPGSISVQGSLQVNPRQTLALIGGEVRLESGSLTVAGGRIELGSVAAGGVAALTPTNLGWQLNYQGVQQFEDIRLTQAAQVESNGNGGGSIQVQGRRLSLINGSQILTVTEGTQVGGDLIVRATDSVAIVDSNPEDSFYSRLATRAASGSTGNGGNLTIETGTLRVADGGSISTATFGAGDSGDLTVQAQLVDVTGTLFTQADTNSIENDDSSTGGGGDLTIETGTLRVADGGSVLTDTDGVGNGGDLTVRAQLVEVIGSPVSFLSAEVLPTATGRGGNLTIETETLRVTDGARISTDATGPGNGGNLTVRAQLVEVTGFNPSLDPSERFPSLITAESEPRAGYEIGDAGNLIIETGTLRVDGGVVSTTTFGPGNGGNLTVRARLVEVVDSYVGNDVSSGALTATADLYSTGNAGNITIETGTLRVADSAQILTSTNNTGNGGNLTVRARLVEVTGFDPQSGFPSRLNTPTEPGSTGNAGRIVLSTNRLHVANRGEIRATSEGMGSAGDIEIQAASQIVLTNGARISSNTNAGNGNITLTTPLLFLRRGSSITTTASGNANGGNITIDAQNGLVVAIPEENSDIIAIAEQGNGGRIDITAQQILGFQESEERSPLSEINASSQFGTAGTILLNTPVVDLSRGSAELPADVTNASTLIAIDCSPTATAQANQGEFYQTGRGGIAPLPTDMLGSSDILEDIQPPDSWNTTTASNVSIQEAQGWQVGDRGEVVLVAEMPNEQRHCER